MSSRYEITAVYLGLKHPKCCWDNDDGTQTIIGRCEVGQFGKPGYRVMEIKGTIFKGQLINGMTYRFFGQTKTHDKFGEQFCFDSFVVEEPAGEEGVVAYLSQCNGVGRVTARAMFNLYGDDAVRMLREEPLTVAHSVMRFSEEKALEASEFLKKSQNTERTKLSLFGLLKGRGFPKKVVDHAINVWGAEAAQVVARNPYILMRFKGCGFLKTDKMYLDLGLNPSRLKRQALCCWHAIAKQGGGDTWYPFFEVRNHLRQSVSSATIDVERAMQLATRAGLLSETFQNGQRWVAERHKDEQELRIVELIEESVKELEDGVAPLIWGDIAEKLADVTDHQRENARLATRGFIGCFAGRPGSGKTFTVARIVQYLQSIIGADHIAIAAPTGKAAVRASSAMQAAGLNFVARTLHSSLGFRGESFEFNRHRPLPFKFIIVDEASMIDTAMMSHLLEARDEGAHVLFVGDPNQLAPVGHGAPLRDFLFADVPHGELKEIQRNSGRIVKACSEIIDRSRLVCSQKIDLEAGENLLLLERDGSESQIDTLAAAIQKYQRDWLDQKEGSVDPVWDIQVIVAVNAKSELGRKPLNARLQDLLNPNGRRVAGNPFRVGDKIICTKNGSYKLICEPEPVAVVENPLEVDPLADPEPTQAYVANGEQAEVIEVDSSKVIARLTQPDRTILIPRSAKSAEDDDRPSQSDDESEEASGTGCNWELGFAISGHKSQGSEWPIVVVMVDDYNGAKRVQSKQWIFTGISRGKRLCLIIGKSSTANACCSRDALFQRKTFLKERIVEMMATRERRPVEISDEVLELLTEGV